MFEKYRKTLLPITLFAGSVLGAVAPAGFATADDRAERAEGGSSPYLVGHWKLNDSFQDFTGGSPISTDNTEFVFLNPTNRTFTLEYAFFATDDTDKNTPKKTLFCGCDRDTLNHNGRVRYTMLGELGGGQFSPTGCRRTDGTTATDGTMKTIVFTSIPAEPPKIDDALQAGYQIDIFGTGRTEAGLAAVAINDETKAEIQAIHKACNAFIKSAGTPRGSK